MHLCGDGSYSVELCDKYYEVSVRNNTESFYKYKYIYGDQCLYILVTLV